MMRKLGIAGLIAIPIVTFTLGTFVGTARYSASGLQLVTQAWDITRENYVDKSATEPQHLAYATIEGMLDSLGDTGHSTFLTPDEVQQEKDASQGLIEGIGIEVLEKDGKVVVVAPMENTPAQKAGLLPGDIILKVDGRPVKSVQDASLRIRGPSGTSVTLTIQTASDVIKDVKIVRNKIDLVSVDWRQLPGTEVAHVHLSSFDKGTTSQLNAALTSIKAKNISGIILDLRDNPGGLLEEGVGVASCYLKSGDVVLAKDSQGEITHVQVIAGNIVTDLPVITLINKRTASAAEIVAGALQDAKRTTLVGETTFGTGTVLEEFPLTDGSAVLIAVQEWLTPSGKSIWHVGLAPDIPVDLAEGVSPLFPTSEQDLTSDQLQNSKDGQLLRALSMLSPDKPGH